MMNIKKYQQKSQRIAPTTIELAKFRYSTEGRVLQLDHVIIEQPLQIRLLWQAPNSAVNQSQVFSITMRTPGDDKALIIGLMLSEGVIEDYHQLESILPEIDEHEAQASNAKVIENQWEVKLKAGLIPDIKSLERFQVTYSSCGLCGTTSLKSLEMKNPPSLNKNKHWLTFKVICAMPEIMRAAQAQFVQTGGSHAAALFDEVGQLIDIKEDIGRHNALDKLFGASLVERSISQSQFSVLVSGRISFEIVQKTVMAGVAVLIAVGAPSELAILAAKRFDLTLIGFTKKSGFNLYHGDWRLLTFKDTAKKVSHQMTD
ncbi:formate dehydrogenase accessory sulfurtransferase FdhD [Colwellia sp. BRX10-3]|uniref:formate dehydrogenase accessory sulfurtransferase FdhD n=1 Tax=Colwellia sp. BRX10-3 TaxID=2759844 RepID=UPI0015F54F92|nr:formate dehydrogenase accessory sulfurtransferase FdhD [Colwellia sp. BRX10-3]MBA6391940.1 formate dehydrogenase accessory sulfurtransferase FdhD [Colwellia sp. BRX10-3]